MPQAARVITTQQSLRTAEADQGDGSHPVLATVPDIIVALTMSDAGPAASTLTLSIGTDELHKLVSLVPQLLALSSTKGANLEAGRARGVGAVCEKAFPLPPPAWSERLLLGYMRSGKRRRKKRSFQDPGRDQDPGRYTPAPDGVAKEVTQPL